MLIIKSQEEQDKFLKHYGILRKSGRYPYGSGAKWGKAGDATRRQRAMSFFEVVEDLERQGLTRAEIAKGMGMTTTQLRDTTTIARNAIRRENQIKAEKLRDKGWSATAIGKEFDPPLNESSVRALLNPQAKERAMILENTVDMLRSEVDKGGYLDIGAGQEYYIPGGGISKEKLRAAVAILKDEGYVQIDVQVPQAGVSKQYTNVKVLAPPGTTKKDVFLNMGDIHGLTQVSDDGGRNFYGLVPPMEISSSRVKVNYKEMGGADADGVIYVRRGVKDVDIGGSSYAQVRINVDGTHYLKGMAMYSDKMPPGVDLVFNTNKSMKDPKVLRDGDKGAMKPQSDDKDNPFGAMINRQIKVRDPDGTERATSVMNIIQEEGKWDEWSRSLSSQVLSKQSYKLADQQLGVTHARKKAEYDEIMALTNPTVKAKLLKSFADSADSDAVHLSAAGLPRSSYHVILPFNSLKDREVYAPNFKQGEKVALIRYPHGGTFEIPELTVNNNAPAPKAAIGRAKDAIGINSKVAERLSGADFDGDFVMVVPNDSGAIKSTPALRQLEKFDPQSYKLPDDVPRMTPRTKGIEMGDVSNLITDMTIKGAPMDEIARAVKHSMVVIDAEKHHLDYKRSAQDNGIAALKKKYQGREDAGAATLVSRATSTKRVDEQKLRSAKDGGPIDRATGKLVYEKTGAGYTNRKGKWVPKQTETTKLADTDDAHTLVSKDGGTKMERVYADHSNRMKALASQARKDFINGDDGLPISPTAKKVYAADVAQLKRDLDIALMNSPRERTAQVLANAIVKQKKDADPSLEGPRLKKVQAQALAEARTRAGAKKTLVPISDTQWEAIQAGAVSKSMLKRILDNADIERVKELATPKPDLKMDTATTARAKALANAGLTQSEIARILGVSLTTLKKGLG